MNIHEWQDVSNKEEFRDHYEFCKYAVVVNDCDEDCDIDNCDYEDMVFGLDSMPVGTVCFYLIPDR